KGKINRQKVELKIIQQGDSLVGTSYYYESANNYRRYSIRGYFDPNTNSTVWWDDQLLDERSGRFSVGSPGKVPMLSRADFNCPGSGKMMLNGNAYDKDEEDKIKGAVNLDKINSPQFADEWDNVIENYTTGGNDPDLIDSVVTIAGRLKQIPEEPIASIPVQKPVSQTSQQQKTVPENIKPVTTPPAPAKPLTIEEKFVSRKKIFTKDIPLSGDSIELRFYDNGEIDGDSISLFLNDQLVFIHLLLSGKAHIIKLAISELKENNELTMVAENLGRIPPNTSYMEAVMIDGHRYSAYLASNEGSSAMIRLIKPTH
ncbi:MAG TPA: hypothetical protein VK483_07920, partial [Chitinophagaceae bacterium]|nr:hypothetical protein [Chitinophagaceae bacterium]